MEKRLLFILIISLLNSLNASAQSWVWGEQGITGIKSAVFEGNIATDKTGNVYQTGSFENLGVFGTHKLVSSATEDAYLVKYDQNGNVLWATQSNTISYFADGHSVATDDSDNAYITGITGTVTIFGADTLWEPEQLFLVKYDPAGNVVWATQPDNNIVDGTGYAVATDNSGDEYVTGTGAFLIKYDRSGNSIWTVTPTVRTSSLAYSVAPDSYGDVYISGTFQDSLIFGTHKLYASPSGVFIIKFDGNGNVLWAQSTNGANNTVYSVAADREGAAYLTGTYYDSIKFNSYKFTCASPSTNSFFVVKYDSGGTLDWGEAANTINGSSLKSYSVSTDDFNHIYISGGGSGNFIFANDTVNLTAAVNNVSSFLIKLDTSGNALCSSTLEAGGGYPNTVSSDSTGKFVYLGGIFQDAFVLGNDTFKNYLGGFAPIVARWQPCGECYLMVAVTPPSTSVCAGQSVPLTVGGGLSCTWSPAIGLSVTSGDTVVATPPVTTAYTIFASSGTCTGTNTVIVTVNSNPIITAIPNPASYCPGGSSTLTASGGTDYTWSPSTNLSATTGATVIANPTVTTTYTVTGANANGCTATTTLVVTVGNNLLITADTPLPLCDGSSEALTASGATNYTWTPSSGLSISTGATVMAAPTVTTTYTISGSDGPGCTGTTIVTVNVNPIPTIMASPAPVSYCSGGSSTLTASGGNMYTWSPSANLSDTIGASVVADPTITTIYTVTGTNLSGCSSSNTVMVTVDPTPAVTAAASPVSYCPGGIATLTASGGNTYNWSPSNGLSATTGEIIAANPTLTTTYIVIGANSSGCQAAYSVIVTVNSNPTISAIPYPSSYCIGGNSSLVASGGKTYYWSPSTDLSDTTGANVTANPSVTTTYTITGTSSFGCTSSNTVTVTVTPNPTITTSENPASFCIGGSSTLTAYGGDTYTWSPSTGLDNTMAASVTANPTVTTVYSVTGTTSNGCSATNTITVTVNPNPTITATADPPSYCVGNNSGLSASGGVTYTWSPSTNLSATTGDLVMANPSLTTTFFVTGTNSNGCSATDSIVITVNAAPNKPIITQYGDVIYSNSTQGNQWVCNDTLLQGATDQNYTVIIAGWYEVIVFNPANGCGSTSDSIYISPTGINLLTADSRQVSVYPNPTSGEIIVSISSSVEEVNSWYLQVTDELGRTVYTRQSLNYSNEIDLSNLSSGVYFICVINKTGRVVVPVVKQ